MEDERRRLGCCSELRAGDAFWEGRNTAQVIFVNHRQFSEPNRHLQLWSSRTQCVPWGVVSEGSTGTQREKDLEEVEISRCET